MKSRVEFKFPTSKAWGSNSPPPGRLWWSNSLLPGTAKVSNARGMPGGGACWSFDLTDTLPAIKSAQTPISSRKAPGWDGWLQAPDYWDCVLREQTSAGSRPWDKGGAGVTGPKKNFRLFGSQFGGKIRGVRPPGPSPGSSTANN